MTSKLPVLLLALAACGNVQNDDLPDAGSRPDAAAGAGDGADDPDAEVAGCQAAAAYGTPVLLDQSASHAKSQNLYVVGGTLDGSPDAFQLQLYGGYGVFADGVVPGIFDIVGDETQFATCGACALVLAAPTPDLTIQDPDRIYLASAGTVEITSIAPNLSGSVRNLVLDHVTIEGASSTVVGDCQSTIERLAFDAPVVELGLVATHTLQR